MARTGPAKTQNSSSAGMGNAAAKANAAKMNTRVKKTAANTDNDNVSRNTKAIGSKKALNAQSLKKSSGNEQTRKRTLDVDSRLNEFDAVGVESPEPSSKRSRIDPQGDVAHDDTDSANDYVDGDGENLVDSSENESESVSESESATQQKTSSTKTARITKLADKAKEARSDQSKSMQNRSEGTDITSPRKNTHTSENGTEIQESSSPAIGSKRTMKNSHEMIETSPYDVAFSELQKCPGGHLTAKSSGGKSNDVTEVDRETSKRIRVALNVLHFKNALHDMRDTNHLYREISQVYKVYRFARSKDLKKALEANASNYRWFFRTKRRNVLANYIQNNLYAQVSDALLRYFDFPRSYTEAQKETVIRDMRDYGLDRMNNDDKVKIYSATFESVYQGISTDSDRFEDFTNLDTVVSAGGFRRHLLRACPPPPYDSICTYWKSTTNLLRYIHDHVTRSKDERTDFLHPVKLPYFLLEHIMMRPEEKSTEPYFLVERSTDLVSETKNWKDQDKKGKEKVSFDFQIPVELETYVAMMLHGALCAQALKTLGYLQKTNDACHGKAGAIRPDHSKINPYLAVGNKKASDVYKVMVLSDRQMTIGVKDKVTSPSDQNEDNVDNDDEAPSLDKQNMNRRWITCLRLYCAIDGSLPLLATGPWAGIVAHYRRKLNSTPPDQLLTADDSDNEAAGIGKGSKARAGEDQDDLAAEDEKNTAETEKMLSNITDVNKRRRLSKIMMNSREDDDDGF